MSRILEIKTVQTSMFKILTEALKEILTDVNIEFTAKKIVKKRDQEKITGGMTIIATNNTKTVLVHLKLDAENFEVYNCKRNKITIGINMPTLYKYIKSADNTATLTLYIDSDNINELGILIENKDKRTVDDSQINLLDLDDDEFEIPETSFTAVATMSSNDFHKTCRDMSNIGENIEIKCVKNELILTCKGEYGKKEKRFEEITGGLHIDKSREHLEIVQGVYELKNLTLFTKCTNLCSDLVIYMKNDYPLIIRYTVASLGNIHLCLTPITFDEL